MYTKEYIKNIFHTGSYAQQYDKWPIVELTFLLNQGLLNLQEIILDDISKYNDYINKITTGEVPRLDIEGGSDGHLALKLIGRDFLKDKGYEKVLYEIEFEGNIPDVISPDRKDIVECGNTNPDKFFKYFKNIDINEITVIPYPSEGEGKIIGYTFIPSNKLAEFLLYRELELGRKAFQHHSSHR